VIAESARRRVLAVLSIAARIADASDSLGREARAELARTSGLSTEGIELALATSLETAASESDLARLAAWAGSAPRCHVVASANVCTASVRALALALATSAVVTVKPSRRDPGLVHLLVRELTAGLDDAEVTEIAALDAEPGDHVHAYGSDLTLAEISRALPSDVVLRGHGTGFGVALVRAGAPLDEAARRLAADVVVFDQQGCLSPRIAFVEGRAHAATFARSLHEALSARARDVPPGRAVIDQRAVVHAYRQSMAAVGPVLENDDHLVTLDEAPESFLLPPPARVVAVLAIDTVGDAPALLGEIAPFVTTIGSVASAEGAMDDAAAPLVLRCPGARLAALGSMQRPPLDGPVDLRPARG
jgi:acyl-CoA reductase-like NAD-dependent aldehyde dehydrogenase